MNKKIGVDLFTKHFTSGVKIKKSYIPYNIKAQNPKPLVCCICQHSCFMARDAIIILNNVRGGNELREV